MKKTYILLFATVLTLLSCQQSSEKMFKEKAEQLNNDCPMMISEFTRVDSASYSPADNTYSFFYTLVSDADTPEVVAKVREELESNLPQSIKKAKDMDVFREHKVTMQYVYSSESSKRELFRVRITSDKYR